MKILKYSHILFSILFFIVVFFLLWHVSPVSAHEGQVHEIVDTSAEQKNKLQECLAQPTFQDSCYFALCENRNPYLCTEDILDAVVALADSQKAMDVLNGIMDSRLFAIKTEGHLLAHVIGNAIAHHYGLSGESFLKCPDGFNWGCVHGFFENALTVIDDPVRAAMMFCESVPERPSSRKGLCYHGVGHIFMFNETYDLMSALSLCDKLPSKHARRRCYGGVFMERTEKVILLIRDKTIDKNVLKEELGLRDDDILAPCNRIEYKYRDRCYLHHTYYLSRIKKLSMSEASDVCLNAGDYVKGCMMGLALMVARPASQVLLMENSNIKHDGPTVFIENADRLCDMLDPDYIEFCQTMVLVNLTSYYTPQDNMGFCLLYGVDTSRCFKQLGRIFHGGSVSDSDAMKKCEEVTPISTVPEKYRNDCYQGVHEEAMRVQSNANEPIQNIDSIETKIQSQNTENEQQQPKTKISSSRTLPYLFITLGCIFLIVPVVYYFRYRK